MDVCEANQFNQFSLHLVLVDCYYTAEPLFHCLIPHIHPTWFAKHIAVLDLLHQVDWVLGF